MTSDYSSSCAASTLDDLSSFVVDNVVASTTATAATGPGDGVEASSVWELPELFSSSRVNPSKKQDW